MARVLSSAAVPRSRTLSANDWIAAAMEAIVDAGVGSVAVETLATRLGATKGSFYHHFPNRDALIAAALDDWEREKNEAVFVRLDLIPDPADRVRAVMAAAFADKAGGLRDAALFASATHPLIRPVVQRVTDSRLKYLAGCFVGVGLPRPQARRRATVLYLSYIGIFDSIRLGISQMTESELVEQARELFSTLIPAG